MPITLHRESCGSNTAPEIEGEDLSLCIPPELQSDQREKDGLSSTCRTDDQGVADITDVK
jgi:hypothetical protein